MSQFTTPLIVEYLDGKFWKIIEPFEYHLVWPAKYLSDIITVTRNFITDFASIPRIFWAILPPIGKYGKAAVIHDWLYRVQIYSRARADMIFWEAMIVLKVPKWKCFVMYKAVRYFGWWTWMKRKKELKNDKQKADMSDL